MRIPGNEKIHLTYCLNVHPGESLQEVEAAVFEKAAAVFAEVERLTGIPGPFGLGLWLSATAAKALDEPGRLEEFGDRLAGAGFYVFTLNGFPYGRFHGARVKEAVYRPDWSDPRRLDYTRLLARILASLLPEGTKGNISTVPVTYRQWADEAVIEAAVHNLAEAVKSLSDIRESTGKTVSLALEPEPDCFLEKINNVIGFFTGTLFPGAVRYLSGHYGFPSSEAENKLRCHLGVCLDAVHAAVVFEDPADVIRRLYGHGIKVCKVHLGAALKTDVGSDSPPDALRMFQDDVYLHQVRVRTVNGLIGFPDLPEALADASEAAGEWRVHYHVPLTWEGSKGVATTRDVVDEDFFRVALSAGVRHFEVETYTLGVFPDQYANHESILAEDIAWVAERIHRQ